MLRLAGKKAQEKVGVFNAMGVNHDMYLREGNKKKQIVVLTYLQ